jgi:hypothetical protein
MIPVPIVVALVVGLGTAGKLVDLRRKKRAAEASRLEAEFSQALARDSRVASLGIKATARIPLRRRRPAMVELTGRVPTAEAYRAVLQILQDPAPWHTPHVGIIDRIVLSARPDKLHPSLP